MRLAIFPRAALLAPCFAIGLLAQTYTMQPFAGGALPGNTAGTAASLSSIGGLAIDRAGNAYLALGDYHIVLRLDAASSQLTRVAGTGTAGSTGDGGAATSARLDNPSALAVDANGNLFIADGNSACIRKVTVDGMISTIAGNGTAGYSGDNGPASAAQFDGPAGLAVSPSGDLYVADFNNQVVRRISNGVVTTVVGNGGFGGDGEGGPALNATLAGPIGLAVDSAGNLYIADAYNNRVRVVKSGLITTVAGTGTAGFSGDKGAALSATLKLPSGVALDSSGRLYIADFGNNRIRMVSGTTITTVAGNGTTAYSGDRVTATAAGLAAPQQIATDAAGTVYVADGTRLRAVVNNMITTMAGGGAPAGENQAPVLAQLLFPQGLATDSFGSLYIADAGTAAVSKVASGILWRVAGGGGTAGDNVAAVGALLSGPAGAAVAGRGVLYIADPPAGRVRAVTAGVITTVAGGGTAQGENVAATSALLRQPQAVAADAAGNLYIADANRVRLVSGGAISTIAGTGSSGYQGDSGPATAAMLSGPTGLAVDTAGNLYIADTGNNRIRKVSGTTITTVAGNGTYGFSGSMLGAPTAVAVDGAGNLYVTDAYRVLRISGGKMTTIGGLAGPQGVAVDGVGNVYVSAPSQHRVYVLAPVGAACTATIAPLQPVSAAGGTVAVALQTGANCAWAVENLPAWARLANDSFGLGAGTVMLSLTANNGAPRTATITIAGLSVAVVQAGSASIAGQVALAAGGPLAGVNMQLSGARSATGSTDSGGNYEFPDLDSTGSYTVTPTLAGYVFIPASLSFSSMTSNPTGNFVAWPQPRIAAMGPAFVSLLQTTATTFAAGEIVTLYGSNLCSTAASAQPTLPDRLAGCIVQVDGVNIRLYYAAATQINAVLPQSLATGAHQIAVGRYTDTTYKQLAVQGPPLAFTVDRVALAFVERAGQVRTLLAAQYLDGGFADVSRPVHAGDYLVLYLTGLGRMTQVFAEGAAPKTTSSALEAVQVQAQTLAAQMLYSGVQPQYPGLEQITVRLPAYTLAAGQSRITLQITAPATGQTLRYDLDAN